MRKIVLGALIAGLFITQSAFAHHPGAEAGLGTTGPIRAISASTLPKGKWAFSFQFEYFDLDPFSNRELLSFAGAGEDVHSTAAISHAFLVGSYGITDDITLSLKFPYIYLDDIKEAHADEPDEVHVHGDSEGIGDFSLLGQYRFFNSNSWEASFILGLEFPTGQTDEHDIEDERFSTEFQPGSGSWDPFGGIAVQKKFGKVGLYGSLLYSIATEGAQDTNLGDMLSYNAAVSYTPLAGDLLWDLILELNGEFKQKQDIDGIDDPNSGGNVLLLSPGTRLSWNRRWTLFCSLGVPIVQDWNGIQNDLNYRVLTGVGAAF